MKLRLSRIATVTILLVASVGLSQSGSTQEQEFWTNFEKARPGGTAIVSSPQFSQWLKEQPQSIYALANGWDVKNAILVLDLYAATQRQQADKVPDNKQQAVQKQQPTEVSPHTLLAILGKHESKLTDYSMRSANANGKGSRERAKQWIASIESRRKTFQRGVEQRGSDVLITVPPGPELPRQLEMKFQTYLSGSMTAGDMGVFEAHIKTYVKAIQDEMLAQYQAVNNKWQQENPEDARAEKTRNAIVGAIDEAAREAEMNRFHQQLIQNEANQKMQNQIDTVRWQNQQLQKSVNDHKQKLEDLGADPIW